MEFYYLWKKTPGANNNRPHRRRRAGSLRRIRVTRQTNTPPANKKEETPEPIPTEDNSSLTEDDASECDSDSSITNKRKYCTTNDEHRRKDVFDPHVLIQKKTLSYVHTQVLIQQIVR